LILLLQTAVQLRSGAPICVKNLLTSLKLQFIQQWPGLSIVLQYNIRLLYGWQTATILRHKMKKWTY